MGASIPNPLIELHQKAGAEMQAYDQAQIVSTFGEPEAEYAAIRKAAAIIDQPQRGVLELTGKDRLAFLNNLLTNQTWDKSTKRGLEAGQGVYAFFLGKNGRIVTDMTVIEREDRTLLEMDARLVEPVRAAFDKYLFGEQVKMANRVESLRQISLHGPQALAILRQATGTEMPELPLLGSTQITLYGIIAIVWRDDPTAVPGFHLLIETQSVERVWTGLLEQFGQSMELGRRALRPAGWAAFNATRVEAGIPISGIDFDDSVLPHETGQIARAVSFDKGCYLGQEIVARMQARGQFARQLVGIRMSDDSLPIAGAMIYDDNDNQIGGITSSTVSPVLSNAAICLGLVKKAFTPVGTVLTIPAEGTMRKAAWRNSRSFGESWSCLWGGRSAFSRMMSSGCRKIVLRRHNRPVIVMMPVAAAIVDATVCERAENAERHGHHQEPAAEEPTFNLSKHVFSPFIKRLPDIVCVKRRRLVGNLWTSTVSD